MGLTTSWLVEGRIAWVEGFNAITLDEVLETDRKLLELLSQKSNEAALSHTFIDLRNVEKFSFPIQNMSRALTHLKHPSLGWSLLVTNNKLIKSTGWHITQISMARFRTFYELEDAAAFLMEQDLSLPPFEHLLMEREQLT